MNPTAIRAWVEALESGQYKQTRGQLATADRTAHCCLGVACEVAINHGVDLCPDIVLNDEFTLAYDGYESTLPPAVQDWLGIPTENPCLGNRAATMRNDDDGETFTQIAQAIRATYPEAFQEDDNE